MTTWTCPGCRQTIEATAVAVGHRCPARRNHLTDWTAVDIPPTEGKTPDDN